MLELPLNPGICDLTSEAGLPKAVLGEPTHTEVKEVLGVEATLKLPVCKAQAENLGCDPVEESGNAEKQSEPENYMSFSRTISLNHPFPKTIVSQILTREIM